MGNAGGARGIFGACGHLKKGLLSYSFVQWDERQILTSFGESNLTVFRFVTFVPPCIALHLAVQYKLWSGICTWTYLPAVLTILFCIYVLLFNTLVSSTFSSSVSSFWPLTGHNRITRRNLKQAPSRNNMIKNAKCYIDANRNWWRWYSIL